MSLAYKGSYTLSSESVSEGHPDKVCDQVSDAILDLYLSRDPVARTAVECLVTTNRLIIAGEVHSKTSISNSEIEARARECIRDIGYTQQSFDYQKIQVEILLHRQSPDIALGVDEAEGHPEGAGDQGMMFGYACDETDVLIPAHLHYSHCILRNLSSFRKNFPDIGLLPDAKAQLSLRYYDGIPLYLEAAVLSTQHEEKLPLEDIRELVVTIIRESIPQAWINKETQIFVNPTGRFIIGGPDADVGLTGRKTMVDTYGGAALHGGGAFSGKDPTKVDRSAAYMARFFAKNIVAAQIAKRCTIQFAYIIGRSEPISIFLDFHGTGQLDEEVVARYIKQNYSLTPKAIRQFLGLNAPIYLPTAKYGHFGRIYNDDRFFTWERITNFTIK